MRSYLILAEKARRFADDAEIQALLAEIHRDDGEMRALTGAYTRDKARALLEVEFDRKALGDRGMGYERLDQLTFDLLCGVR